MKIALATCAALPTLDAEESPLLGELERRGVDVEAAVWDDPAVDWAAYDLVVIRSTWDYATRQAEFVAWADRVESVTTLVNPAPVVRWNTDKHYLAELERAGVPIVPTMWLEPERHLSSRALHTRFPAHGDFVIKPAVSAGSVDTGRYTAIDAGSRGLAIAHARRLLEAGRTVMVQRYLTSVDTVGERAHIFISGEYSHSVRKGAMLTGPDLGGTGLYKEERMSRVEASDVELDMARHVIATATGLLAQSGGDLPSQPFLYARVDLVSGDDDQPVLMELETVEPSLFMSLGDGAVERFATAILERVPGAPAATV
ncbi:hypothetical protein ICW40_10530 [Actinotalea ferrariae]|uniref:ATP-grasp domain-containing protein n=1 Tax=Actinotalea ferrariae TaxID=1386098 RepID=UPI001C8C2016|nr:hypothetical protein [Actinotalea ferrariae]MBX9245241.1 hypothetical protein [Actinotalea ferrariae]